MHTPISSLFDFALIGVHVEADRSVSITGTLATGPTATVHLDGPLARAFLTSPLYGAMQDEQRSNQENGVDFLDVEGSLDITGAFAPDGTTFAITDMRMAA